MPPFPWQIHVWRSPLGHRSESRQRLRTVLARYETSPQIGVTPRGKPYLRNAQRNFSVSHCRSHWVCAVAVHSDENHNLVPDLRIPLPLNGGPILGLGCDLEYWRPQHRPWDALAQRYFTAAEQALLTVHTKERFFQIWTRKESYGKLTGLGLRAAFAELNWHTLPRTNQWQPCGDRHWFYETRLEATGDGMLTLAIAAPNPPPPASPPEYTPVDAAPTVAGSECPTESQSSGRSSASPQ